MNRQAESARAENDPGNGSANGGGGLRGGEAESVCELEVQIGAAGGEAAMEDWIAGWLDSLRSIEGRAETTVARYGREARLLVADAKLERPGDLTLAMIERHVKRLFLSGRSESSRSTALAAIKVFCRYLFRHRLLERNPAAEIRLPKVYRKTRPVFTLAEMRRLIGDTGTLPRDVGELVDVVMTAVMYSGALRVSEIVKLRTVGDLDYLLDARIYLLRLERAKHASEDAFQPLGREVSRLLGAYRELRPGLAPGPFLFADRKGKPFSIRTVQRRFRALCQRRGIEAKGRVLAPHTLRRSRGDHYARVVRDPKALQRFMRHASLATTMTYYRHVGDDQVVRMVTAKDPFERKARAPVAARGAMRALLEELGSAPAN